MLTSLTAPAFAKTWCIEDGNITVKAGDTGNDVTQKGETTYGDTDTIITNQNKDIASSNTVTIETKDKNDKVEVTLKDVNIEATGGKAAVSVTGSGNTTIELDGDNHLTGGISDNGSYGLSGISSSGSLTISGGETDSLIPLFRKLNNKGRTASLFALFTGISMLSMFFFNAKESPAIFYALSGLTQFFFSGFNTAIYAIIPDCVEYEIGRASCRERV